MVREKYLEYTTKQNASFSRNVACRLTDILCMTCSANRKVDSTKKENKQLNFQSSLQHNLSISTNASSSQVRPQNIYILTFLIA